MLTKQQADALRQFAAEDGIEQVHVDVLSEITGRGYRPATSVDGWREFYASIKDILDEHTEH